MAETSGCQALACHLEEVAVSVLGFDLDLSGSSDDPVFLGEREAALGALLLAFRFDYLGIYKFDHIFFLPLFDIRLHDQADSLEYSYLWRGKADASGGDKGVLHVVEKRVKSGIELFNDPACFVERGVFFCNYISECHISYTSIRRILFRINANALEKRLRSAINKHIAEKLPELAGSVCIQVEPVPVSPVQSVDWHR